MSRINGKQFIKRSREWANANNLEFRLGSDLGKQGHRVVYVGDRLTIVKSGEIGAGLLHAMLRQLNIPKTEFRNANMDLSSRDRASGRG